MKNENSFKNYIVFILENKEDFYEYKEKKEIKFFHEKKNAIKYQKEKKLDNYQVAERILMNDNLFTQFDFEEALKKYAKTNYMLKIYTEEEDKR